MPKRQKKAPTALTTEGPRGPNAFFCEHCQIPLTSAQHANQHFTGKRHRMVVAGKVCPKGSGYYDKDGNWVKMKKADDDPTGRFGIGTSFLPTVVNTIPITSEPVSVTAPAEPSPQVTPPKNVDKSNPNRYCALCNISVTSDSQMQTHVNGAKHKKNVSKKIRVGPSPPSTPVNDSWSSPEQSDSNTFNENPANGGRRGRNEFSIYRTPSGQYYCQHCNVTAPNEAQFDLHQKSKSHAKSMKAKK